MPSRTPIKAILFDLDDTLWPIVPVIRKAEQTCMSGLSSTCRR